jgi:hypothetical protein
LTGLAIRIGAARAWHIGTLDAIDFTTLVARNIIHISIIAASPWTGERTRIRVGTKAEHRHLLRNDISVVCGIKLGYPAARLGTSCRLVDTGVIIASEDIWPLSPALVVCGGLAIIDGDAGAGLSAGTD